MVAAAPGQKLEERDIFWIAAPAVADAGPEIARADALVEPHAVRDLVDVGPDCFGHVRDLVDEADPRREEGVRRELDHLRGGDARPHDRSFEAFVERGHPVAVLFVERADHDPVRDA